MNIEQLTRQVRQHLESLRSAGVEFLPFISTAAHLAQPMRVEVAGEEKTPEPDSPKVTGEAPADATGAPSTLEQRRQALSVLALEVSTCVRCAELASTRTQTVFADGRAGAELCFIGEAPGADEDAQGKPFVGAAGQLLDRIILACGMKREDVYICNTIKCRPPGNRTPRPDEIGHCREYFDKQLALAQPKFICALGLSAAQSLLNTTESLGRLRGRLHDYKGIPVLVTYHPAYLLPHRSPDKKKDVWQDMKLLMERMGRPIK